MEYKLIKEKLVLKKKVKKYINNILLLILIVISTLIINKQNLEIRKVVHEKFSILKNREIYEKYFGNILTLEKQIKKEQPVFNEKIEYQKLEKIENGIKLTIDSNQSILVIESGVVVYKDDNKLIVEQIDGVNTTYENINTNIKLYDYVEKNEVLGVSKTNYIILKFNKGNEVIDYKKYI